MGILGRLFGRKPTAPKSGEGLGSIAASLAQQNETLTPKSCDLCGTTYLSSEAQVCLISMRAPAMRVDIGGYCPRCRKHLCQRHLALAPVMPNHLPEPEKLKDASYGVVCEKCGTRVRHNRDADPARFVTIIMVDAKDLEPSRPRPTPEFSAPSGKFSLAKIAASMPQVGPIPNLICMQCFAFHPHPVTAPMFGLNQLRKGGTVIGPEDFEVDIGADCPVCGAICGKHIVLKEIEVEGKQWLGLYCAIHDERLS